MRGGRSDPQPNGWTWRPGRGRGRGGGPKIGKLPTMHTAKRLENARRQENALSQQNVYRNGPPQGEKLFEARLVVAGIHIFPDSLDADEILDEIRTKHQVWITSSGPVAFDITSRSMANLQEALKAMHQLIHDLRLADIRTSWRFLIQPPSRVSPDAKISFLLNSRPAVTDFARVSGDPDNSAVLAAFAPQLGSGISAAAETLMCLGKDLKMRVNFGRLNLRQRKKGTADELTYAELAEAMKPYVLRGSSAAGLGTKMPDTHRAEAAIRSLVDASQGVCHEQVDYPTQCTFAMTVQGRDGLSEVNADIVEGQTLRMTVRKLESRARMDWTTLAPDRQFDWNFRVTASDETCDIQQDLKDLIGGIKVSNRPHIGGQGMLQLSHLAPMRPGPLGNMIEKTWLKSSITIPMIDEPYVVEINVTQTWNGCNVTTPPDITWGLEVFGVHWDETINNVVADGRRRDWGPEFIKVWTGDGESLEKRLEQFLLCILRVQGALDTLEMGEASGAEKPTDLLI